MPHRRHVGTLTLITSIIWALMIPLSPTASAYNTLYCRFDGTNAKFFVAQNDAPSTSFENAGDEWEVGTSGIALTKVTDQSTRHLYAYNIDFGYTGWTGMLDHYDEFGGAAPNCLSSGHWNYNKIAIMVNTDQYFSYVGTTAVIRKGIAIHEFGHFLGLAHTATNLGCPGGGLKAAAIMYPNDDRFFGDCGILLPQSDDKVGINALY